ncbi:major facilitator superfamily protein [Azoarcus sp. CIB]|uniref:MFS transporter n=1 Tax=Aromatoleum sp. (strain CIB) TaxID=198107 RepID=UPI0006A26B63|nr:MFS transporter [Azoarcus sp. CIB]AKU11374.1 major facilitator superfamily protein [Azoarcus sp. CIB]
MDSRTAWKIYAALLFGTFVTIEAAAFQAPALPSLTKHFGIPINLAALVLMSYFVGLTVFAPIMGRLGDQRGRKRVLLAGLLVFALSEFAAAAAANFHVFLAARFAQGLGVACILPGVFAYIGHLFPEQRRGMALGIFAMTMTLGAASGGLLGGLLIDRLGWPSVYWISGALALAGLVPVALLVPDIRSERSAALFATIAALLSLPTWIGNFGLRSPYTAVIVATGVLGLTLLWRNSQRVAAPVIDVAILRLPAFALPSAIYWLHLLSFSGVVYALAFFINGRPGGSAAQFGFVTLFLYGSSVLASPLAGRLVDRIAPRHVTTAALAVMLAGLALLLTLRSDTPLWFVIATVCVLGLAMGCNTPAVMKLALGAVPPERLGAGTGLFSTLRDLGAPTGSSVSLATFSASLAFHKQQGTPDALAAALGTVGWLLVGLIGLALLLSLRLERKQAQQQDPRLSPPPRDGQPVDQRT